MELDEQSKIKVRAGISRLWVRPDYQRKGIASRMVDAMRKHFAVYHHLGIEEFAFSHTTPNGTEFAVKYTTKCTGKTEFLTYAPALSSQVNSKSMVQHINAKEHELNVTR